MTVMMRNNLFEEMNRQWDCIVSKNTCFQRVFMGTNKSTKKISPWKTAPKKTAANSDPNPNPDPNPGGNLLGCNLSGSVLRGEIFQSPQKRRVNKEYGRRKVSGIQVLIFVPVYVFVFLTSIFLF